MEIHFQTIDHVVAVEKAAEQHIGTKYSKCNSLRVLSHIIILGKSATHSSTFHDNIKSLIHSFSHLISIAEIHIDIAVVKSRDIPIIKLLEKYREIISLVDFLSLVFREICDSYLLRSINELMLLP